ncbi:MAG: hypothetical protein N2557_06510 [Hydrogenophilus sp.]|nr:hypothetical protein [Hydrogenophilus sp.]
MPDRLAPGCGWWITPPLSRALGLSLLAVGGAAGYIFFLSHRRQPLRLDPLWQILYFSTLVVPALVLILLSAIAAYGPLAHTHQPPAAQVKCMR